MPVKPAVLLRAGEAPVIYRERFAPASANLQFLSCGEYEIAPGARTQSVAYPGEEALLFSWRGQSCVSLGGHSYALATYDTLYVPRGQSFAISNPGESAARLFVCRAPAENVHPVFHSEWARFSRDEARIRHLKGKDVFLMFDVSEKADKLVAGYTFFEPYARSWPPHNHTDQEEVYIFINGHGSMEVYESPESLTFVHNVKEGDAVTIPFLNYHPVFSQEDPLEFIWCIAGERYWVGDKNKDFMKGTADSITT
ncbi:MAG: 5-deoxy-glucuronate isomerase [Candidatus Solibacter usitatus]|nr:5-deoxy-glucuronate isomerase [Candidatus Solibacter usitatus]